MGFCGIVDATRILPDRIIIRFTRALSALRLTFDSKEQTYGPSAPQLF